MRAIPKAKVHPACSIETARQLVADAKASIAASVGWLRTTGAPPELLDKLDAAYHGLRDVLKDVEAYQQREWPK